MVSRRRLRPPSVKPRSKKVTMYKAMMEQARKDGVASDKMMWESIAAVDELLETLSVEHPELYNKFIRKQHAMMYGPHFNEFFAEEVVEDIRYTDRDGKKKTGPYWTVEEVEDATRSLPFPAGTTRWDKYVAFNLFRSDVGAKLDDQGVISVGHAFFFADEDAGDGKVWKYVCALR